MNYGTLITATALNENISQKNWVILDCRFSLADTHQGGDAYRHGHIPGAHYVHLDKDLSSAVTSLTGRHPLPNLNTLVRKMGQWGINNSSQVIVYDSAGGAFAGRLWWLLRLLGHSNVAVLDGGIQNWQKTGHVITTTLPTPVKTQFRAYINDSLWITSSELQNQLAQKNIKLIDARTPERFRGEQEPIDPIAGHIPEAINRPFQLNLDGNGCFKSPANLRAEFSLLLGQNTPEQTVHMCGSGVTACHNLLAMEHAGLCGSILYAGSWSEWITNPNRPIAKN